MQLSSNGWPVSKDQSEIGVKSFAVKGTDLKIRCAEKVAPLLCGFIEEFNNLIEPIDGGVFDDWSYAYRNIRGSEIVISNHASGTAIDLNSTVHPLGKVGTFDSAKVPMLRALAKKYGLKWGGDFKSRKDEMHFEVAIPPVKVAAFIKKLEDK